MNQDPSLFRRLLCQFGIHDWRGQTCADGMEVRRCGCCPKWEYRATLCGNGGHCYIDTDTGEIYQGRLRLEKVDPNRQHFERMGKTIFGDPRCKSEVSLALHGFQEIEVVEPLDADLKSRLKYLGYDLPFGPWQPYDVPWEPSPYALD